MRITSIKLPDVDGLRDVQMGRLGEVVVIAGPNGGGKSRLLKRVLEEVNALPSPDVVARLSAQRSELANHIDSLKTETNNLLVQLLPKAKRKLAEVEARLSRARNLRYSADFVAQAGVEYVPRAGDLRDERNASRHGMREAADSVANVGCSNLLKTATAYLSERQNRWLEATHPHAVLDDSARETAVRSYEQLQSLLRTLINASLERNPDGDPTLLGRPIAKAGLSDGQTVLLQLAVSLHAQGQDLDGHILFLDEPELHLHPAAVIDVLERLRQVNPSGQVWIATHAISILAWAPPESLWFIRDGRPTWAGRDPELVLEGLLGGSDGRERLEAFLQLPAQLASNRFASECLLPPEVVMTGAEDRQLQQIRRLLHERRADRPLRVLDFGAGKGRLLAALRETWTGEVPLHEAIDYWAFDVNTTDREARASLIDLVYGESESARRCLDSADKLIANLGNATVNVVVMCNVLHEIEPTAWTDLFGPRGYLPPKLREDGVLLVVEDQHIPTGEKAHRHGFLLLDNPHLRQLFGACEDTPVTSHTEPRGRLKAHVVPGRLLSRATKETRQNALDLLIRSARDQIKQLRDAEPSARNGQLHGLWTQLFANATLALESFN